MARQWKASRGWCGLWASPHLCPQRLAEFLVLRSLRIAGVSSCFRRFVEEI